MKNPHLLVNDFFDLLHDHGKAKEDNEKLPNLKSSLTNLQLQKKTNKGQDFEELNKHIETVQVNIARIENDINKYNSKLEAFIKDLDPSCEKIESDTRFIHIDRENTSLELEGKINETKTKITLL